MRWMEQRGNHPSIILWVVFNEAWGQFDTVEVTPDFPVFTCVTFVMPGDQGRDGQGPPETGHSRQWLG